MKTIFGVLFLLAQAAPSIIQAQDIRVHDPVMIVQDSVFHLFCTGKGISQYQSTDLIHWESLPGIFPSSPEWVLEKIPAFGNHIWAPDISFYQGKYWLFYSVSEFAKNNSCIGLVSTPTLDPQDTAYTWTDHGAIICSTPGKDDWNAIDPNFILDERGNPWLTFGSFWNGIQLIPLKSDLSGRLDEEPPLLLASRKRTNPEDLIHPGDGAIEAPFIVERNGWYYLFTSFDYCCRGEKSTYHVRVGRSKALQGPYLDKENTPLNSGGGTLIFEGNERWAAAGHNAVVHFQGKDLFLCHGYDNLDQGHPKLIIRRLNWEKDAWPVIEKENFPPSSSN